MACGNEQEGSGFVVGQGLVATNAHVVAGESHGNTQIIVGDSAVRRDDRLLRSRVRPGRAAHQRAARTRRCSIDPNVVGRGTQAAVLGYPEDGGAHYRAGRCGRARSRPIGRDIYNNGTVTRGVYELDADVLPGNSGGPLLGPGRPGDRRGVLPLDRLSRRRLRPDLAGGPGPGPAGRDPAVPRSRTGAVHLRLIAAYGKNEAMSQRIEDYALIGDLHTAALVGRDGSIDWLCLPRFDSASCFARLLGDETRLLADRPGRCARRVIATRRRYRPDTLVLETEFDTATGTVRITDCMPVREEHPQVVRLVEG